MRPSGARPTIAVAMLSLLAMAGCDRLPAAGPKPAGGYPDCRPDHLALKRVTPTAADGSATYNFENRDETCVLKGHVVITLTGADGKALTGLSQTNVEPPPELQRRPLKVVLRPGRKANFSVAYPRTGPAGQCRGYVKLTATPPGSDWGLDAAEAGQICGPTITVSTFWYDSSQVL